MKRKLLLSLCIILACMTQGVFGPVVSSSRGTVNLQLLNTYGIGNATSATSPSMHLQKKNNDKVGLTSCLINVPYKSVAYKKVFPTGIDVTSDTPTSKMVQNVGYVLYYLFVPTNEEYIRKRLPAFPPRHKFGKYF